MASPCASPIVRHWCKGTAPGANREHQASAAYRSSSMSREACASVLLAAATIAWTVTLGGCSDGCRGDTSSVNAPSTATRPAQQAPAAASAPTGAVPATLPRALLVTYAQFRTGERGEVQPGPARLEILRRDGGEWHSEVLEDPESNVFHKAMLYERAGVPPAILTIGGMQAMVKLWRRDARNGWTSETLWAERFGGRFDRMRDVEVAELYAGEPPVILVGTHDQGVVVMLRGGASGFEVTRLDAARNTFIHEIEIGDLDRDGVLEVYASASEPNTLEGGPQPGHIYRYVPQRGGRREVVADFGQRHAKEILVADVDGDGRDELYAAVEALTAAGGNGGDIREPVEIRRFERPGVEGSAVIAQLSDRFTRFLTVGDVDGDGKRELVVAAFSSGLWLLRPPSTAGGQWSLENFERESGGFEHASLLTDLDGDRRDELYVASDNHGELRRYDWVDGHPVRSVVTRRESARSMITWNIMPAPVTALYAR